jgi:glyoxylase-like metal-dependent hydrolase (beta-lactamase superfamily II)
MQVAENVHMLRLPFTIPISDTVRLERFASMFIVTGPTITLIDAGVAGSEETVFEYIRSIGRDPAEIALLILTHSHPDHIGGAMAIREETGCRVAAHAGERAWIEDVNLQCRERPVPGFHALVGGPVPVDQLLEDGDVVELGTAHGLDCVVFHTPGHSQGSISLLMKQSGVLFTGDAVPVSGAIPVYDDVLSSVDSLKRLARIDGIRIMLSSWDNPQEGILAYQQLRRALDWLQQVHTAVLHTAADCPADPMELCRRTATVIGLPVEAATPMLARTFSAHLPLCNRPRLLIDDDTQAPAGGPVDGKDGALHLLDQGR